MDYLNPISNLAMVIIWVIYLQLFLIQYRRGSRPYLVIHHGQNESADSMCLLVNMGKEAVHVQCVQVVVQTRDDTESLLTVTRYERVSSDDNNLRQSLRQGPLESGDFLVLGSFRDILTGACGDDSEPGQGIDHIRAFTIRAAVMHGPSSYPVGARRRFYLEHNGKSCVFPEYIYTEQLTKRRSKREVSRWIERELNPRHTGQFVTENTDQSA